MRIWEEILMSEKIRKTVLKHIYPARLPTHYVSGAMGRLNPFHFTIDFYTDTLSREDFSERVDIKPNGDVKVISDSEEREKGFREVKSRLQMTPLAAKQLADWIYRNLDAAGMKFENEKPNEGGPQYV